MNSIAMFILGMATGVTIPISILSILIAYLYKKGKVRIDVMNKEELR